MTSCMLRVYVSLPLYPLSGLLCRSVAAQATRSQTISVAVRPTNHRTVCGKENSSTEREHEIRVDVYPLATSGPQL